MFSQPIAELRNVSKRFGPVTAASHLDLTIRQGEFLSFLGPSGCGKTTALRMLAGFEQPSDGEVLIDGIVVNGTPAHHRPVNMVFQQYALFPHMDVAANVAYGLTQRRPRPLKSDIAEQVAQALAMVRLEGFAHRRIWEMSGGQQQRVALARAIVNRPKILLLDEPMAALDKNLRHDMQIELKTLQRELGITFVLVTHDQDEALSMSDRICIMGQGRIRQIGSAQELYDQPASRYVADFVGRSNFIAARVTGRTPQGLDCLSEAGIPFVARGDAKVGQEVTLSLRPENIRPVEDGLAMTVTRAIFLGEQVECHLQGAGLPQLVVTWPRLAGQPVPDAGDTIRIGWKNGAAIALTE